MNEGVRKTCLLLPPPGPLAWLHPELLPFCKGPAPGPAGRGGPRETRDLAESPLGGTALADALSRAGFDTLRVQPGPRGYALWTWLRQALRGTSVELIPPGPPAPPCLTGRGSPGSEEGAPPPIESLLAAAAGRAGRGGTVLLERGPGGPRAEAGPPLAGEGAEALPERGANAGGAVPVRLLPLHPGPGLEGELDRVLDTVSRQAALFRGAGLLPFFVTAPPAFPSEGDPPVETRLHAGYWGVLPGSRYGAGVRTRFRELVRLLCPERAFLFRALENHALAGVDLYVESLMDRFGPAAPCLPHPAPRVEPRGKRPLVIGVCGMDGSGKSSHVSAIEAHLRAAGLRVRRHKIYRHGVFHDTVTDLTRRCRDGRNLHLWRLQRLIKLFDSLKYFYARVEADLGEADVLLFDRYVFTHYAAGRGRFHHDPFAVELLSPFPPADRIYLLDVPVETALERIGAREERTVDENPYMLGRYRHLLLELADRHGFMVLDGREPLERNRARILEDVDRIVRARRAGREA